jgi:hypothetical protein
MLITPNKLFLMGWGYYIVLPCIFFFFDFHDDIDSLYYLSSYFEISEYSVLMTILYSLSVLLFFYAPSKLKIPKNHISFHENKQQSAVNWILFILYLFISIGILFSMKSRLFSGYTGDFDVVSTGPLATIYLFIYFQIFLVIRSKKTIFYLYITLLIITTIGLLSLGGRIYVLTCFVGLYIYWWNYKCINNKIRLRSLLISFSALIFFAAFGMIRMGFFEVENLFFYMISESILVSISFMSYFGVHQHELFNLPIDFIGSFANLIPSFIYPVKLEIINQLENIVIFSNPGGALSILTSSAGNFGILGGLLFFFLIALILKFLQVMSLGLYSKALYIYSLSVIPFIFFREPFSVQNKVIVTGFLLFFMNIFIAFLLNIFIAKKSNHATPIV